MEKCFACGKPLTATQHLVDTRDAQTVYVGPDCFKHIKRSGAIGWQPTNHIGRKGPRLYPIYEPTDAEVDAYIARLMASDIAAGVE